MENQFKFQQHLFNALNQAKNEGLTGIILTNTNPETDFKALLAKNESILKKNELEIKETYCYEANDKVKLTFELKHLPSGETNSTVSIFDKKDFELKTANVYIRRRISYEGLLGIASTNDLIEAEIYGPTKVIGPKKEKRKFFIDPYAEAIVFAQKEMLCSMLGLEIPIYNDIIREYRQISWSDIKLFLKCKRCFYYSKKLNVSLNLYNEESFGLEKFTDKLLKKEFDIYRENNKKHPIMNNTNIIKPASHCDFNIWRGEKKSKYDLCGIHFEDAWDNYLVHGIIDDIWINDKKELVIVDYKSSTTNKIYPEYKKQLEFYSWIFKKRNYTVASIGYLLFYCPKNKDNFEWIIDFNPILKAIELDDSWVQNTIYDALECLTLENVPNPGNGVNKDEKCHVCEFIQKISLNK